HHERIVMFGKRWTLLHEPWLDKGVFMRPLPSGAPNPFSLERFTDFSTYKDLTITELHEYFNDAPAFREMMEGLPAFRDAFVKQVNAERASSLKTIRDNLGLILSDIQVAPGLWNVKAGVERSVNPTLKLLLYKPGTNSVRKFSPIHYCRQDESGYPFMNEYQAKVD
ncbi:hypothetical protein K435DRAFT_695760, partial [Dendrothele bispora CBS 962.96]